MSTPSARVVPSTPASLLTSGRRRERAPSYDAADGSVSVLGGALLRDSHPGVKEKPDPPVPVLTPARRSGQPTTLTGSPRALQSPQEPSTSADVQAVRGRGLESGQQPSSACAPRKLQREVRSVPAPPPEAAISPTDLHSTASLRFGGGNGLSATFSGTFNTASSASIGGNGSGAFGAMCQSVVAAPGAKKSVFSGSEKKTAAVSASPSSDRTKSLVAALTSDVTPRPTTTTPSAGAVHGVVERSSVHHRPCAAAATDVGDDPDRSRSVVATIARNAAQSTKPALSRKSVAQTVHAIDAERQMTKELRKAFTRGKMVVMTHRASSTPSSSPMASPPLSPSSRSVVGRPSASLKAAPTATAKEEELLDDDDLSVDLDKRDESTSGTPHVGLPDTNVAGTQRTFVFSFSLLEKQRELHERKAREKQLKAQQCHVSGGASDRDSSAPTSRQTSRPTSARTATSKSQTPTAMQAQREPFSNRPPKGMRVFEPRIPKAMVPFAPSTTDADSVEAEKLGAASLWSRSSVFKVPKWAERLSLPAQRSKSAAAIPSSSSVGDSPRDRPASASYGPRTLSRSSAAAKDSARSLISQSSSQSPRARAVAQAQSLRHSHVLQVETAAVFSSLSADTDKRVLEAERKVREVASRRAADQRKKEVDFGFMDGRDGRALGGSTGPSQTINNRGETVRGCLMSLRPSVGHGDGATAPRVASVNFRGFAELFPQASDQSLQATVQKTSDTTARHGSATKTPLNEWSAPSMMPISGWGSTASSAREAAPLSLPMPPAAQQTTLFGAPSSSAQGAASASRRAKKSVVFAVHLEEQGPDVGRDSAAAASTRPSHRAMSSGSHRTSDPFRDDSEDDEDGATDTAKTVRGGSMWRPPVLSAIGRQATEAAFGAGKGHKRSAALKRRGTSGSDQQRPRGVRFSLVSSSEVSTSSHGTGSSRGSCTEENAAPSDTAELSARRDEDAPAADGRVVRRSLFSFADAPPVMTALGSDNDVGAPGTPGAPQGSEPYEYRGVMAFRMPSVFDANRRMSSYRRPSSSRRESSRDTGRSSRVASVAFSKIGEGSPSRSRQRKRVSFAVEVTPANQHTDAREARVDAPGQPAGPCEESETAMDGPVSHRAEDVSVDDDDDVSPEAALTPQSVDQESLMGTSSPQRRPSCMALASTKKAKIAQREKEERERRRPTVFSPDAVDRLSSPRGQKRHSSVFNDSSNNTPLIAHSGKEDITFGDTPSDVPHNHRGVSVGQYGSLDRRRPSSLGARRDSRAHSVFASSTTDGERRVSSVLQSAMDGPLDHRDQRPSKDPLPRFGPGSPPPPQGLTAKERSEAERCAFLRPDMLATPVAVPELLLSAHAKPKPKGNHRVRRATTHQAAARGDGKAKVQEGEGADTKAKEPEAQQVSATAGTPKSGAASPKPKLLSPPPQRRKLGSPKPPVRFAAVSLRAEAEQAQSGLAAFSIISPERTRARSFMAPVLTDPPADDQGAASRRRSRSARGSVHGGRWDPKARSKSVAAGRSGGQPSSQRPTTTKDARSKSLHPSHTPQGTPRDQSSRFGAVFDIGASFLAAPGAFGADQTPGPGAGKRATVFGTPRDPESLRRRATTFGLSPAALEHATLERQRQQSVDVTGLFDKAIGATPFDLLYPTATIQLLRWARRAQWRVRERRYEEFAAQHQGRLTRILMVYSFRKWVAFSRMTLMARRHCCRGPFVALREWAYFNRKTRSLFVHRIGRVASEWRKRRCFYVWFGLSVGEQHRPQVVAAYQSAVAAARESRGRSSASFGGALSASPSAAFDSSHRDHSLLAGGNSPSALGALAMPGHQTPTTSRGGTPVPHNRRPTSANSGHGSRAVSPSFVSGPSGGSGGGVGGGSVARSTSSANYAPSLGGASQASFTFSDTSHARGSVAVIAVLPTAISQKRGDLCGAMETAVVRMAERRAAVGSHGGLPLPREASSEDDSDVDIGEGGDASQTMFGALASAQIDDDDPAPIRPGQAPKTSAGIISLTALAGIVRNSISAAASGSDPRQGRGSTAGPAARGSVSQRRKSLAAIGEALRDGAASAGMAMDADALGRRRSSGAQSHRSRASTIASARTPTPPLHGARHGSLSEVDAPVPPALMGALKDTTSPSHGILFPPRPPSAGHERSRLGSSRPTSAERVRIGSGTDGSVSIGSAGATRADSVFGDDFGSATAQQSHHNSTVVVLVSVSQLWFDHGLFCSNPTALHHLGPNVVERTSTFAQRSHALVRQGMASTPAASRSGVYGAHHGRHSSASGMTGATVSFAGVPGGRRSRTGSMIATPTAQHFTPGPPAAIRPGSTTPTLSPSTHSLETPGHHRGSFSTPGGAGDGVFLPSSARATPTPRAGDRSGSLMTPRAQPGVLGGSAAAARACPTPAMMSRRGSTVSIASVQGGVAVSPAQQPGLSPDRTPVSTTSNSGRNRSFLLLEPHGESATAAGGSGEVVEERRPGSTPPPMIQLSASSPIGSPSRKAAQRGSLDAADPHTSGGGAVSTPTAKDPIDVGAPQLSPAIDRRRSSAEEDCHGTGRGPHGPRRHSGGIQFRLESSAAFGELTDSQRIELDSAGASATGASQTDHPDDSTPLGRRASGGSVSTSPRPLDVTRKGPRQGTPQENDKEQGSGDLSKAHSTAVFGHMETTKTFSAPPSRRGSATDGHTDVTPAKQTFSMERVDEGNGPDLPFSAGGTTEGPSAETALRADGRGPSAQNSPAVLHHESTGVTDDSAGDAPFSRTATRQPYFDGPFGGDGDGDGDPPFPPSIPDLQHRPSLIADDNHSLLDHGFGVEQRSDHGGGSQGHTPRPLQRRPSSLRGPGASHVGSSGASSAAAMAARSQRRQSVANMTSHLKGGNTDAAALLAQSQTPRSSRGTPRHGHRQSLSVNAGTIVAKAGRSGGLSLDASIQLQVSPVAPHLISTPPVFGALAAGGGGGSLPPTPHQPQPMSSDRDRAAASLATLQPQPPQGGGGSARPETRLSTHSVGSAAGTSPRQGSTILGGSVNSRSAVNAVHASMRFRGVKSFRGSATSVNSGGIPSSGQQRDSRSGGGPIVKRQAVYKLVGFQTRHQRRESLRAVVKAWRSLIAQSRLDRANEARAQKFSAKWEQSRRTAALKEAWAGWQVRMHLPRSTAKYVDGLKSSAFAKWHRRAVHSAKTRAMEHDADALLRANRTKLALRHWRKRCDEEVLIACLGAATAIKNRSRMRPLALAIKGDDWGFILWRCFFIWRQEVRRRHRFEVFVVQQHMAWQVALKHRAFVVWRSRGQLDWVGSVAAESRSLGSAGASHPSFHGMLSPKKGRAARSAATTPRATTGTTPVPQISLADSATSFTTLMAAGSESGGIGGGGVESTAASNSGSGAPSAAATADAKLKARLRHVMLAGGSKAGGMSAAASSILETSTVAPTENSVVSAHTTGTFATLGFQSTATGGLGGFAPGSGGAAVSLMQTGTLRSAGALLPPVPWTSLRAAQAQISRCLTVDAVPAVPHVLSVLAASPPSAVHVAFLRRTQIKAAFQDALFGAVGPGGASPWAATGGGRSAAGSRSKTGDKQALPQGGAQALSKPQLHLSGDAAGFGAASLRSDPSPAASPVASTGRGALVVHAHTHNEMVQSRSFLQFLKVRTLQLVCMAHMLHQTREVTLDRVERQAAFNKAQRALMNVAAAYHADGQQRLRGEPIAASSNLLTAEERGRLETMRRSLGLVSQRLSGGSASASGAFSLSNESVTADSDVANTSDPNMGPGHVVVAGAVSPALSSGSAPEKGVPLAPPGGHHQLGRRVSVDTVATAGSRGAIGHDAVRAERQQQRRQERRELIEARRQLAQHSTVLLRAEMPPEAFLHSGDPDTHAIAAFFTRRIQEFATEEVRQRMHRSWLIVRAEASTHAAISSVASGHGSNKPPAPTSPRRRRRQRKSSPGPYAFSSSPKRSVSSARRGNSALVESPRGHGGKSPGRHASPQPAHEPPPPPAAPGTALDADALLSGSDVAIKVSTSPPQAMLSPGLGGRQDTLPNFSMPPPPVLTADAPKSSKAVQPHPPSAPWRVQSPPRPRPKPAKVRSLLAPDVWRLMEFAVEWRCRSMQRQMSKARNHALWCRPAVLRCLTRVAKERRQTTLAGGAGLSSHGGISRTFEKSFSPAGDNAGGALSKVVSSLGAGAGLRSAVSMETSFAPSALLSPATAVTTADREALSPLSPGMETAKGASASFTKSSASATAQSRSPSRRGGLDGADAVPAPPDPQTPTRRRRGIGGRNSAITALAHIEQLNSTPRDDPLDTASVGRDRGSGAPSNRSTTNSGEADGPSEDTPAKPVRLTAGALGRLNSIGSVMDASLTSHEHGPPRISDTLALLAPAAADISHRGSLAAAAPEVAERHATPDGGKGPPGRRPSGGQRASFGAGRSTPNGNGAERARAASKDVREGRSRRGTAAVSFQTPSKADARRPSTSRR